MRLTLRPLFFVLGALLWCGGARGQSEVTASGITSPASTGLVINEVYVGTTAATILNPSDQFIELYNGSTTTQYLDGCLIVRFGTGGKLSNGVLQSVSEAWKIPGKVGGRTQPVPPNSFIVIAATAKAYSGGVDLTNADYETYWGLLDQDGAGAQNMSKVGGGLTLQDIKLSSTQDAIVLANGKDTVLTDGLLATTVIDGIQYSSSATRGALPAAIDAGVAGGTGLRLGVSLERKQKGMSSLNSATDFVLTTPTPGYQHGATTPKTVRVIDILPLTLGRYVDYDSYSLDTNGTIIAGTKTHSSYTVTQVNQTFQGEQGAIAVRDTSNAIAGIGSTSDLHYLPTSAGDLKIFADQGFIGLFVPSALGSLVTPPNVYVDYLKMSGGVGKSYAIATISQDVVQSGVTLTVTVTTNGTYMGLDPIVVANHTYDTAYKFVLKADLQVTAFGFPVTSTSVNEQIWIVPGVGIVKSALPAAKGSQVPIPGSERDMVSYGVRSGVSAVGGQTDADSPVLLYPNPANARLLTSRNEAVVRMIVFDQTGKELLTGGESGELDTHTLPCGSYVVRIELRDGSAVSRKFVIQR